MKRKPNLLLRAIWISVVVGVARTFLDVFALRIPYRLDSPEGAGYVAGTALSSVFIAFIPVGIIVLIWQVIHDFLAKKKS